MSPRDTGPLRFFLMEGGEVIERDYEPAHFLEGYHSLAEMREALTTPDGSDEYFREKLMGLADELRRTDSGLDTLNAFLRPRPQPLSVEQRRMLHEIERWLARKDDNG